MNPRAPTPVSLFDKYTLGIPPRLVCHEDGKLGQRILFISDQRENFTVSFEEGMKLMDMTDDPERDGITVSVQCRRDGKYLHLKRCGNVPYAFFHIELEDPEGNILYLPGQIVVSPGYKWSDGIEPVLLELLSSIQLSKAKNAS